MRLSRVLALTGLCWLVAEWAVGPLGNFPLNDDWSYAWTTKQLCEHGSIELLPWSAPSLLLQIGYGAALCKLFGWSFTLLRLSTLLLAPLGLVAFFLLLRRLSGSSTRAGFATVALGGSPLFFSLSNTFMTEVPFVVVLLWAALFYLRTLERYDWKEMAAASVFCCAAILIRQNGLFLAAAASVAMLFDTRVGFAQRLWRAVMASIAPLVVFVAYHVWLFAMHGAPAGASIRAGGILTISPLVAASVGFRIIEYLGLLLMPLALVAWHSREDGFSARAAVLTAGLGAVAGFLYISRGELMYYLPNILHRGGVGALTLRDALFLGIAPPFAHGNLLAFVLTLAATVSAGVLSAVWLDSQWLRAEPHKLFMPLCLLAFAAGSLLQADFYFDRYLLPMLPFAIASVLCASERIKVPNSAWALVVLVALYSLASTHDYLSWNRARHQGLDALMAEGHSPREIDGGVEFNGWHLAAVLGGNPSVDEARIGQSASLKSWWWVVDDRFVASFTRLPGYHPHSEQPWSSWLGGAGQRVFILERDETEQPAVVEKQ